MSKNSLLIINADIYPESGQHFTGWLRTIGRKIEAIGEGQPEYLPDSALEILDAQGMRLLPGFIDLHVHGALGQEAMDASAAGLTKMAQYYAQHGVTGFLATTWTAPHEEILRVLEMAQANLGPLPGGAALLGVHLEGPYLNPEKCGAQDVTLIRRGSLEELQAYLSSGVVRLIAVAPEFPENLAVAEECVRHGVTVSAGHTSATYEQMQTAVQHGVTQVTHCFNAMTGLHHRKPGTVGAALALPEIRCELIADKIHVHPAVMQILLAARGVEHVILITDAVRGTGLPDGEYPIGGRTITIHNGEARLPDGTLAGSVLTMNRALKNLIEVSGRPLQELWPASSLNAARAVGLAERKGSLAVGKDADLVLLDENFEVFHTVVEGNLIYSRTP